MQEMRKRKASDPAFQSEGKKHLTEKEKHTENVIDAIKINTISAFQSEGKKHLTEKEKHTENVIDAIKINTISAFQSEERKHLTEKEKHTENVVDAIKINTISDMKAELTTRTLLMDQGCTTSSLSSFTEKITDEASIDNNFTSTEKENSSSTGGGRGGSDEVGSDSVVVESISNMHEASLKKNEILDCHDKLDRNDPPATNPSLSGSVKSELAGEEDQKVQKLGSLTGSSENRPVPEKVQNLGDKDAIDIIAEPNGSNNALAPGCEVSADEFGKISEAHGISTERNAKEFSVECREHPSPIRGVIHDFTSLKEAVEDNLLSSSKKEEICFSFQTTEKFLSDNQSEKASSAVESHEVFPTIKGNDDPKNTSCIVSGITKSVENKEDSILASHSTENCFTSEVVSAQDKRLEAMVMEPERSLVSCKRKKLLVLDLNGLLADIILDIRNVHRAQKKVGGKAVFKRPFCDDFLKFCFEKFEIGVWSSRRKYNVDSVLDFLMGDNAHKLLFCWDQSHCTFTGFRTPENVHKPLVLKELKKLWNKEVADLPWEMGDYSPSNTILVDDSPYKALCNPPHTAIFPYPYRFDDENDTSLGPGGDLRVYLEGLYEADDVRLYVQQHPFGQQAITNSDSSWNFYLQVIEKVEQSLLQTE